MRLEAAGAIKIFTDTISGKGMERSGLAELFAYGRAGDTMAVVRLDRRGRSLRERLETVKMLRERQIDLLSLEEEEFDTNRNGNHRLRLMVDQSTPWLQTIPCRIRQREFFETG